MSGRQGLGNSKKATSMELVELKWYLDLRS